MSELAPLIADLALILIFAGVMTLIFKKLKQPLVLGYIVAGFLASPHFGLLPSVLDTESIHVWSDIGVIFLLFALGLEFSFKKIVKVGGPAIIAALTIIFGMIFLGFIVGSSFGWSKMDAIFLGGMIAMSSTTIIYKAFDDMGLKKKQFTGLVMSILILEDVLAVVLMVVLSTVAVAGNFEGGELVLSLAKLVFFLILWFLVGIYAIPLILSKCHRLLSDETLLIVALGLCFGMVVVAAKTGFSAAFGAFIMGSILAETVEAEHIDHLVKPVKDLFGAIFFVSVGMMVDPAMIVKYIGPIIAITLTVILGQSFFATVGVLLSGRSLKTAMQCGFSLTQIGEFAFIIASLGVSLKVTGDFLYPIVVAVSVITIFLTPYMIRLAEPAYNFLWKRLPPKWQQAIGEYGDDSAAPTVTKKSEWKTYISGILKAIAIYGVICIAIVILGLQGLTPLLERWLPEFWAHLIAAVAIISLMAPFLRSMMLKMIKSPEFKNLWESNKANRAPLVASVVIRVFIAAAFVFYTLARLMHISIVLLVLIALTAVVVMIGSRILKKNAGHIEKTFMDNLNSRDRKAEYLGEKAPQYASKLLSKDIHLAEFDIPGNVAWAGKTLAELNFGKRFGIQVVSILRGDLRINIPRGTDSIYPQDRIQVIASDAQIETFSEALSRHRTDVDEAAAEGAMTLSYIPVGQESPFIGKTVRESGIRDTYSCLVAGIEKSDGNLHALNPSVPFEEGDILWIVGQEKDVEKILEA